MLPDVPTLGEAGVRGVELTSWFGAIAPDLTFGAAWSGPDDFRALAESEIRRWEPIIQSAGVPKQ